jgi:polyferredoxin
VCPTGVDIRRGQQFGCITCGLCIDACDSVMEKIKKPKGLIRYASLQEFTGKKLPAIWKRPRVIVYSSIMAFAAGAILYGLATMAPIDVKALHERSPLFVQMSDGSIQNKWTLKIVNKQSEEMVVRVSIAGGPASLSYVVDENVLVHPGTVRSTTLLVKIPRKDLTETNTPIDIIVEDINKPEIRTVYDSVFIGPQPR